MTSSIRRGRSIAHGVMALLQPAYEQLNRPCLVCTCTRQMVRDLDPDPDCPGLHYDGCLTDTRLRARGTLALLGIPKGTSRDRERRIIAAAVGSLAHAAEFTDHALIATHQATPVSVPVLRTEVIAS